MWNVNARISYKIWNPHTIIVERLIHENIEYFHVFDGFFSCNPRINLDLVKSGPIPDCSCAFPKDLAPDGIPPGAKAVGRSLSAVRN